MVAIIDYDAGNIKSVEKAVNHLGEQAIITRDKDRILASDRIILPGVGAFGDAMEKIRRYGLEDVIRKAVDGGTPFLGICLGLQLIFESSEESPGVKGLGLLPGKILRIPEAPGLKIPHMGWNSIRISGHAGKQSGEEGKLFRGIEEDPYVYFVHSYYLQAEHEEDIAATCEYGGTLIHAAVEHENICACQFHPEKSSSIGLAILKNFIR